MQVLDQIGVGFLRVGIADVVEIHFRGDFETHPVTTDFRRDSGQHVQYKAHTVFNRSTVFIRALIAAS
ncbi:hypothetical protein D3C87_2179780 [compost metagenome]